MVYKGGDVITDYVCMYVCLVCMVSNYMRLCDSTYFATITTLLNSTQ